MNIKNLKIRFNMENEKDKAVYEYLPPFADETLFGNYQNG